MISNTKAIWKTLKCHHLGRPCSVFICSFYYSKGLKVRNGSSHIRKFMLLTSRMRNCAQ